MTEKFEIEGAYKMVQKGIAAVRAEEYLLGFTLLSEVYQRVEEGALNMDDSRLNDGLSYYGLALALVQKKVRPAVELCRRAIEVQFYNGSHHGNLARVYLAADKRNKAIDAVDEGLRLHPDDKGLLALRKEIGRRSRPAIPFLPRSNPINVAIGRAKHARKANDKEKK